MIYLRFGDLDAWRPGDQYYWMDTCCETSMNWKKLVGVHLCFPAEELIERSNTTGVQLADKVGQGEFFKLDTNRKMQKLAVCLTRLYRYQSLYSNFIKKTTGTVC